MIEGFVVDFFCHKAKRVLEIDGGIHTAEEQMGIDVHRRAVFEARGLKEISFCNQGILDNMENNINTITAIVHERIGSAKTLHSPP